MAAPTPSSVLRVSVALVELGRELGISLPPSARKDVQVAQLVSAARLPPAGWIGYLVRDELRAVCREHAVDASSRSRGELAGALRATSPDADAGQAGQAAQDAQTLLEDD